MLHLSKMSHEACMYRSLEKLKIALVAYNNKSFNESLFIVNHLIIILRATSFKSVCADVKEILQDEESTISLDSKDF